MSIEELNNWKAREYDVLKARVAELESRLSSLDCRYAGGGIGEISGSHCPADAPCDRCVAERRIARLEAALERLLRARPTALECQDFHHAVKDRHEGFDCPCKTRWDSAVESACNLLKH